MDILSIGNSPDHCRTIFSEFANGIFEEIEGFGNTPGSEFISLFGSSGRKQLSFCLFKDGRAYIDVDGEYTYNIENPFRFADRMRELGYSATL